MVEKVAYSAVLESPLPNGLRLGVRCRDGALLALDFLPHLTPVQPPADAIARLVQAALLAYFGDPAHAALPPLDLAGTPFQRRVWTELVAMPCGHPITYGELARRVGSGPRAVAGACGANPVPILVPCHRVIAANGVGGYMGSGAEGRAIKEWLLQHERPH